MSSMGGLPTGVFWDMEDCKIPDDLNVVEVEVLTNMKKALSHVGIDGTTEFSVRAYGDKKDHDFHSAGISFTQSPAGEKVARHKKILGDVLLWAEENPPPANLVLIMEDTTNEFASVILLLKSLNYKEISVHP